MTVPHAGRGEMTADEVIARRELRPHPEDERRGVGTAIYYLLRRGEAMHQYM